MPSLQALLTDTYSLRRAAVVEYPEYPTDLFPMVYGNLIRAKGGVSYCPGIIETTYTYLIADGAVATEAMGNSPTFYADGQPIEPDYWTPSTTVAGRVCATVTFRSSQAGSRIGYRGMGAVSAGALLSNAISIVEHFLTAHVGLTAADFDATALATARAKAAALGYICAGVLDTDRAPGTTVSEILACLGRYYYVSPAGTEGRRRRAAACRRAGAAAAGDVLGAAGMGRAHRQAGRSRHGTAQGLRSRPQVSAAARRTGPG